MQQAEVDQDQQARADHDQLHAEIERHGRGQLEAADERQFRVHEGRLEMVAEFGVKEYDIAPYVPILQEAGGRFTAVDGTHTLSDRSGIATNGILHDAFIDLLRGDEAAS